MGKIYDTHFLSFKIFVNNLMSMESRPIIARRSSSRINFSGSSTRELILRYAVKFVPPIDVAVKTDRSHSTRGSSMSSFGTRTSGYVNDEDSERRTFNLTSPSLTIPPTPPPSPPSSSSPQSAFVTDIYDCFVVVLRARSFPDSAEGRANEENSDEVDDDDDDDLAVTERWIKLDAVLPYLGLSWQSFRVQSNYDGMILSWGHLAERVYGENWIAAGRRHGETVASVGGSGTSRRNNFVRVTWDTLFVSDYLFIHLALNSRNWNFTLAARSLLDEILPTLFHYKITPTISRCVKSPPPIPPKKLKRVQHSRFDEETFFLRRRCYLLDKRIASLEDKLRDLIIDQCRELGAGTSAVATAATGYTDDTAPSTKSAFKRNEDISKTEFPENVHNSPKFQSSPVDSARNVDSQKEESDETHSLYATISERNQADEKLNSKVATKKRGWRVGTTLRKIDSLKLLRRHRCHEHHQRLRSRCSCSKNNEAISTSSTATKNKKKVMEDGSAAVVPSSSTVTEGNDEKIMVNNETNVNCQFEETSPMCSSSSKETTASLSAISSSRMFKRFFFLRPFSWK